MRYPGSEKLEIIRLVEQSHLPVRQTLAKLGILPGTFYRWYERFRSGGPEALEDRSPRPSRVWNRIPEHVREQVVQLALDEPKLSPREVATRFTDVKKYFVSEASVYRLLKAHDLITSPAFIVMKAAEEFKDKTTAPNQPRLYADILGDRSGAATSRRQQNNPGSLQITLQCHRRSATSFQHRAILPRNADFSCFGNHPDLESRLTFQGKQVLGIQALLQHAERSQFHLVVAEALAGARSHRGGHSLAVPV